MSDNFRYRYGDTQPIRLAFKASVAVSIGDCVYEDAADSNTVKPASSYTWQSAIAAPTTPTLTDGGTAVGTAYTNAATHVKISYQFPWGEGTLSAAAAVTPTAHALIKVTGFAVPAPVVAVNFYVETSAGSGVYQLALQVPTLGTVLGIGDTYLASYGVGQIPYAGNASGAAVTSGALDYTQYLFVQSFIGVNAQRYDGTNATAYGIKDGKLRVDTAGTFDFACASATQNPGDLVGMAKATGSTLDPQTVIAVVHKSLAIGVVQLPVTSATTLRVQVFPRKMLANLV